MITVSQIAKSAIGPSVEILGSEERSVLCVAPLSDPAPGSLTYVKPGKRFNSADLQKFAEMVLVCDSETAKTVKSEKTTLLITNEPRLVFLRLVKMFFAPKPPKALIHPSAVLGDNTKVDSTAYVGAGCVLADNCSVGANSVIHANVTLYANVHIGEDVIINSGTVIGADGFGYERNELGVMEKFPHIGGVRIGNGVDIGSNTSIDRGTLSDTIIHDRVKIDNQCHISHNVIIGEDSVVIAQSMIGGSVKIGKSCWIAPSASLINQVVVEDNAVVGLGATVVKHVSEGTTVMGAPAEPESTFKEKRGLITELHRAKKP